MKLLLDVNDSKVAFLLEVLGNFSFVKEVTTITNPKEELIQDIKEAVEELKLIKKGELKGISAEKLLDEL